MQYSVWIHALVGLSKASQLIKLGRKRRKYPGSSCECKCLNAPSNFALRVMLALTSFGCILRCLASYAALYWCGGQQHSLHMPRLCPSNKGLRAAHCTKRVAASGRCLGAVSSATDAQWAVSPFKRKRQHFLARCKLPQGKGDVATPENYQSMLC